MTWLTRNLPAWLSLSVLAAIVVGVLLAVGWIKPYLAGPDLATTTIYRPKPVPVKVETVKWLTRTDVRTERVEIPVEVIREVPAKTAERIERDFGITLPELAADNRELVEILAVPKAPHGGEMAITVSTASGEFDGIFRPRAAPMVEFGGMREVGFDYDLLGRAGRGYYRQDLVRIGPAVFNAKAFVEAPIGAAGEFDAGVSIGVAVRF